MAEKVLRPDGQEQVLTLWQDGTWQVWGGLDDYYSREDGDYFMCLPIGQINDAAKVDIDQAMATRTNQKAYARGDRGGEK